MKKFTEKYEEMTCLMNEVDSLCNQLHEAFQTISPEDYAIFGPMLRIVIAKLKALKHAHAEGNGGAATGEGAHSEGLYSNAVGNYSHAEGAATYANALYSHAGGQDSAANGQASFATGYHVVANRMYQTVVGKYNLGQSPNTLFEVGNGTAENARNNAFEVYQDGTIGIPNFNSSNVRIGTKRIKCINGVLTVID